MHEFHQHNHQHGEQHSFHNVHVSWADVKKDRGPGTVYWESPIGDNMTMSRVQTCPVCEVRQGEVGRFAMYQLSPSVAFRCRLCRALVKRFSQVTPASDAADRALSLPSSLWTFGPPLACWTATLYVCVAGVWLVVLASSTQPGCALCGPAVQGAWGWLDEPTGTHRWRPGGQHTAC